MARRYDNLAYNYQSTTPAPMQKPHKNPNSNIRIKNTQKNKSKSAIKPKYDYSVILRVALIALFAFFVLYRGVIITDKTNQLSEKKKELANLQAKNEKLQVEIEKSLDLARIEEIASEKLNMRRPEKYQIVYINLDRTDFVEKADGTASSAKDKATKLFNSIKSYLD